MYEGRTNDALTIRREDGGAIAARDKFQSLVRDEDEDVDIDPSALMTLGVFVFEA